MNKQTGKKIIHIHYSDFYRRYFIWSDLTQEEILSVEGVKHCNNGINYKEMSIDPQYDSYIVLNNIKRLAKQKAGWGWIKRFITGE